MSLNSVKFTSVMLRAGLLAAVEADNAQGFLRMLEAALFVSGPQVNRLRLELSEGPLSDEKLLESLDTLLAELSSKDGPTTREAHPNTWCTFGVSGVFEYRGEHALMRPNRCPALELSVAEALGVSVTDVHLSPLVMSADGAYALTPSEAIAVATFGRAGARDGTVNAELGDNAYRAGSRGTTSIQVCLLVHVQLEANDEPADVLDELHDWAATTPEFILQFNVGEADLLEAKFSVASVKLPWDSFQRDVYDYDVQWVCELARMGAARLGIERADLNVSFAIFEDADQDQTVRACFWTNETPSRSFGYHSISVNDAPLLLQKMAEGAFYEGMAVYTTEHPQYQQGNLNVWHEHEGLVECELGLSHLK